MNKPDTVPAAILAQLLEDNADPCNTRFDVLTKDETRAIRVMAAKAANEGRLTCNDDCEK